jgi:hypothetical protein
MEARTRGFASPALAGFAFIAWRVLGIPRMSSILGCAYARVILSTVGRMSAYWVISSLGKFITRRVANGR